MAIYRFSKWRPSAMSELFYHHTRPPTKSVAGRNSLRPAAATQLLAASNPSYKTPLIAADNG